VSKDDDNKCIESFNSYGSYHRTKQRWSCTVAVFREQDSSDFSEVFISGNVGLNLATMIVLNI